LLPFLCHRRKYTIYALGASITGLGKYAFQENKYLSLRGHLYVIAFRQQAHAMTETYVIKLFLPKYQILLLLLLDIPASLNFIIGGGYGDKMRCKDKKMYKNLFLIHKFCCKSNSISYR
jgi:hypothetical protein